MMGAGTAIFSDVGDDAVRSRVVGLFETVTEILDSASAQGLPTSEVADDLARARIAATTDHE